MIFFEDSIAYLIWKGSYNVINKGIEDFISIAYLIWKGSYNIVIRV